MKNYINRLYLDYTEDFKEDYIERIKEAYREKCLQDQTLKKEYKEHVKNLDNLTVEFTYGYDLKFELSYVTVEATYHYRYSYKSGEHVSGTASINSYGDLDTSGLSVVSDYNTTTYNGDTKVTVWSKDLKKLKYMMGSAYYSKEFAQENKGVYKSFTVKNMPAHLKKVYNETTITVADFEKALKIQCKCDSLVWSEVEADIKRYSRPYTPKDIEIKDVCDYSIRNCELYFMPSKFIVKTVFNGTTYKSSPARSIEDMAVAGAQSDHYKRFQRAVSYNEGRSVFRWLPRMFTIMAIVVMGLSYLGLMLGLLDVDRGLMSLIYENSDCTSMCLAGLCIFGPIALDALYIKLFGKEYENEVAYANDVKIYDLLKQVDKKYKSWKRNDCCFS